jgi:hypothetical protein
MEMWHYTSGGKQMSPVSLSELKQLLSAGGVKPTDMVWKEGMPRWVRASTVKELYADALDSPAQPVGAVEIPAKDDASPPAARRVAEPVRSPRRRQEPRSNGGGLGIIIVMVLAGVLLLGALLGGVVIILAITSGPRGDQKPVTEDKKENDPPVLEGEENYEAQMGPGQRYKKSFTLRAGVTYEIRVIIDEPQDPGVKADLSVFRGDIREPIDSGKTRSLFKAKVNATYRIEVANKSADKQMKATVTIKEADPAGGKVIDELPKDVHEGSGKLETDDLKPGESRTFKFRVKAGHKARISATVLNPQKGESRFNLYVAKEGNPNDKIAADVQEVAKDTVPHPLVQFSVPNTEIVQVRVHNASATATNRCSIIFNVSK